MVTCGDNTKAHTNSTVLGQKRHGVCGTTLRLQRSVVSQTTACCLHSAVCESSWTVPHAHTHMCVCVCFVGPSATRQLSGQGCRHVTSSIIWQVAFVCVCAQAHVCTLVLSDSASCLLASYCYYTPALALLSNKLVVKHPASPATVSTASFAAASPSFSTCCASRDVSPTPAAAPAAACRTAPAAAWLAASTPSCCCCWRAESSAAVVAAAAAASVAAVAALAAWTVAAAVASPAR